MVLAAIGLVALGCNWAKNRDGIINREVFILTLYALIVGFFSFASETIHETGGNAYVTLFVSMWVWVGAAYAVSLLIKQVHGEVTVRLFFNYVIVVCVLQCFIAFTKEYYLPLKTFVDNLVTGEAFMGKAEGRLYGIGAALDVAGLRFSAILVTISYFCVNANEYVRKRYVGWYLIAFVIIAVIGNMMSRSTTIGLIISLSYLLYSTFFSKNVEKESLKMAWMYLGGICAVIIPIIVILYYINDTFYTNIRFAFEGFFNWWELGRYENKSNTILLNMIVFPDNLSTWIFGDGYIVKPELVDPYYQGPLYGGFYKDTDIGYLLFIFYFGLIGLIAMIAYIVKAALLSIERFPIYKVLLLMILAVNLIGWCKVSTDIFVVFAPFLIIPKYLEGNKNYE